MGRSALSVGQYSQRAGVLATQGLEREISN